MPPWPKEPSEDLNICHQSQGQGSQEPDLPICQQYGSKKVSIMQCVKQNQDQTEKMFDKNQTEEKNNL